MISVPTIMARLAGQASRLRSLQTLLACIILLDFSEPATIASPLDLTLPNLTSLAAHDPDPRFKLTPHYTNERLPATAVLMSTVYLLAEAADLDLNSELEFDKPSVYDDYPSVSISLQNAKPSVPLPCAFLVWGLYFAGMDMIEHNKFVVGDFDVLWKGKITGRLRFQKAQPRASFESLANGSHSIQVSAPSNYSLDVPSGRSYFTKKRTNETVSAPETPSSAAMKSLTTDPILTLRMEFLQDAKTLPIGTVFAMILELLKDDAEFSATARVQSSSTSLPAFDATLDIQRIQGPSMRTPPYFEYAFLNRAIRQLPRLMLSEGKFAEATFQFEVDDKKYV